MVVLRNGKHQKGSHQLNRVPQECQQQRRETRESQWRQQQVLAHAANVAAEVAASYAALRARARVHRAPRQCSPWAGALYRFDVRAPAPCEKHRGRIPCAPPFPPPGLRASRYSSPVGSPSCQRKTQGLPGGVLLLVFVLSLAAPRAHTGSPGLFDGGIVGRGRRARSGCPRAGARGAVAVSMQRTANISSPPCIPLHTYSTTRAFLQS